MKEALKFNNTKYLKKKNISKRQLCFNLWHKLEQQAQDNSAHPIRPRGRRDRAGYSPDNLRLRELVESGLRQAVAHFAFAAAHAGRIGADHHPCHERLLARLAEEWHHHPDFRHKCCPLERQGPEEI